MKAKTELLLYRFYWLAGKFGTPTYRNLTRNFDLWAYHSRLSRRIEDLKSDGLIEEQPTDFKKDRFIRLTEAGKRIALGGRNPEEYWNRKWDQKWKLFLFDLPADEVALRRKFLRVLRAAGCGCLQGSVWISPITEPEISRLVREKGEDCSHLMILEADSKGEKIDQNMVQSAWNFSDINDRYAKHHRVLQSFPENPKSLETLIQWGEMEFKAWQSAVRRDPLLPKELLPQGYTGIQALERRKAALNKASIIASGLTKEG